jgi:hypothetical protein
MTTPPNPLVYLPQRMQADRLKFPGLIPAETVVIRAWLKLNEAQFDRFDYNLRVGPAYVSPTPLSPAVQRNADLLHQLRIDAVGWKGIDNSILPPRIASAKEVYDVFPGALATIIDAKRRATNAAIGQILTYRDNWVSEFPSAVPPDLLLVCSTYTPNITPSLLSHRIQLNTVQADFSILRPRKP